MNRFEWFVFLLLAAGWLIIYPRLTIAQNVPLMRETLPAPPPLPSLSSPVSASNPLPVTAVPPVELTPVTPISTSPPAIREYNFEAPLSEDALLPSNPPVSILENSSNPSTPSNSSHPSAVNFYRVEVNGDSELVLSKVKIVEPLAFIRQREGVIQAGLFQQQSQAEERVRKLENQGLSAKVVTFSDGMRVLRRTSMR